MSTSHERLSVHDLDPAATQAVLGMEKYVRSSGLDNQLYELVKIRASQLNGCAFCLDMHLRDARAGGEDQRRLDVLSAWREAPQLFSEREQAAFALTEAVTLISQDGVPDDVWSRVSASFDDKEIVHLLMAIATINVWNRLAVSTHQALPSHP
jgi:AhpD family alkylhydroperoxidase